MKTGRLGVVAPALMLAAAPASGEDASKIDLAAAFGAREYVEQASLSPDGTKMAFLRPLKGQGSSLVVLNLNDPNSIPKPIAQASGDPERISGCKWVGSARLMCTIYAATRLEDEITYASRIIALDEDGKGMKAMAMPRGVGVALSSGSVIDWNAGFDGNVLMMRERLRSSVPGGLNEGGMAVDRVDTRTLRAVSVERADARAREYITDGQGNVRVLGRADIDSAGYEKPGRRYLYRAPGQRDWTPMSRVGPDQDGFDPYGVDSQRNIAFGLKSLNGRRAAYSRTLDANGKEELLFAHAEVDVSGFARIGRRGRIVGATYTTDRRQVRYFDPELEKLAASLSKALPDTPLIRFLDSSEDESRMLLWAGADNNPGRYFLFDRTARRLEAILEDRPALRDVKLALMRHVTYPAADGTRIPGYLTLPPGVESAKDLPALVMPHGGPGARDEWGFDWLAQYFASQGFVVLQPNFRGSTGYGDSWFQKNGFQGWRAAIGDVNDAGRWLVEQGADAGRLGIMGWSYGGYAALQSAVLEPDLFKAIVAVAPVTDLGRLRGEGRMFSSYQISRTFIGEGPHIAEGSPARHADRFKVPILMFHGEMDSNVPLDQARLMQSRLERAGKKSDLIVYPKLDHYLEDGEARQDMLSRAAAFLKTSMVR